MRRNILITGARSGLGRDLARRPAEAATEGEPSWRGRSER
ncbi:hypothetical protein SUDANB96_02020 [Streptomyces sp. enrichment culture]